MLEKEQLLLLAQQLVKSLSLSEQVFISKASAASISRAFKLPENMTVVELLKLGAEGVKEEPCGLQTWPGNVQRRHQSSSVDTLGILQRGMKRSAPLRLPGIYHSLNPSSPESTLGMVTLGHLEGVSIQRMQHLLNRRFKHLAQLLHVIHPLVSIDRLESELRHFSQYRLGATRITGIEDLIKGRHHREFFIDRAKKVSQEFLEQGAVVYTSGVGKLPGGEGVEVQLLLSRDFNAVHCPDFPAQTRYFRTMSGARSMFDRLCHGSGSGSTSSAILQGSLTPSVLSTD